MDPFKYVDMAANAGMGLLLGEANDRRQLNQQEKLNELQIQGQMKMSDYQMKQQYEMWLKTNYPAQIEQMRKAGLNPALMYGMGGGGGSTTGNASAQVTGAHAPTGGREAVDMLGMGLQYELLKAQKENIEAQTAKTKGETTNLPLAGKNISADTENKILQGIILKYAGQEAERQWSINKELTLEEYGAKSNEFEARKAAADNLIKLYENGTMQKMTETELNQKLAQLGLTNLQVKGTELQNAILELEKNMQTQLGIDKAAPAWIKIIGRLILGFIK